MRHTKILLLVGTLLLGFTSTAQSLMDDLLFLSYETPVSNNLKLYWKDDKGNILKSIGALRNWMAANNKKLLFAMNAGMYKTDNAPLGLYIEAGKQVTPLNKRSASGNFYLKPNGVFYIDNNNKAVICVTEKMTASAGVKYATQSGPMLVIDGNIHPAFSKNSTNINIRNGVGVLPGNKLLFVMSKLPVSFYRFAEYFKKMGCKNALYLDGAICQAYLPEKGWTQTGGDFGVMIGVYADR